MAELVAFFGFIFKINYCRENSAPLFLLTFRKFEIDVWNIGDGLNSCHEGINCWL